MLTDCDVMVVSIGVDYLHGQGNMHDIIIFRTPILVGARVDLSEDLRYRLTGMQPGSHRIGGMESQMEVSLE
jgi:hypothetical protein